MKIVIPAEEIPAPKGPKKTDKAVKKESYKQIMLSYKKDTKK